MKAKLRDKVAWFIANWAINHIATKWYKDRVYVIFELGIEEYIKLLSGERELDEDRGRLMAVGEQESNKQEVVRETRHNALQIPRRPVDWSVYP